MRVRYPDFDFKNSTALWADNVEVVTVINAGAIVPTPIERYMIRVMRQARRLLDPATDASLIADLELFSKQEGQHLKLHAEYLAMVRDTGYPGINEFEAAFDADLRRFLETESLAWNLSYCEGFESSGAAMAEAWINGEIAELCGDHGSVPMQLWRWHLAEEFEHRCVVHDLLQRLYGPDEAFERRKAGAAFARTHIAEHSVAAAAYMQDLNRASMTDEEVAASLEAEVAAWTAIGAAFGSALEWVYQPGYDPAKIEKPRDYDRILRLYESV